MIKIIQSETLKIVGAVVDLINGIPFFISERVVEVLEVAPIILFQSAIFWIAFNISAGSIVLFQLSFIQSLGFVLLIRIISNMFKKT